MCKIKRQRQTDIHGVIFQLFEKERLKIAGCKCDHLLKVSQRNTEAPFSWSLDGTQWPVVE